MNRDDFFNRLGIKVGSHKPAWILRNGIFVVDGEVASYRLTDVSSKDLETIAEKAQDEPGGIFLFSDKHLNRFMKNDGYDHWSQEVRKKHLLQCAAIGILRGNIFVVNDTESANDVADEDYLPRDARIVSRDEFMEMMAIA